ncbi:MAG: hypothetical protein D6719_11410 [Candidatus Dadabacteria bacterium]|nr:MAG: hypothetical protein D6719_11410 [Candidatus Dadabacteria bacterium]
MRKLAAMLTVISLFLQFPVLAEDLGEIFKRANDYASSGNYVKALEELKWAQNELNKKHSAKLQQFLPDTLGGMQAGKAEVSSALGITTVERNYTGDNGINVKASIIGGANNALGGIAALGQSMAMLQGTPGQEAFRIDGKTAALKSDQDNKEAELTVFLGNGAMLKLEMEGSSNGEKLKEIAKGIKLTDLDNYLKGAA